MITARVSVKYSAKSVIRKLRNDSVVKPLIIKTHYDDYIVVSEPYVIRIKDNPEFYSTDMDYYGELSMLRSILKKFKNGIVYFSIMNDCCECGD